MSRLRINQAKTNQKMKTAEFVKKILAKAGVTHTADIGDELPDDIATQADNALLTIAAATNNHPDVKKVYFAQAYNGLDAEIKGLITEFGLSDEVKAEIEAAGGSTKKAVTLARKIKELSEKSQPADKDASKKLNDQITELNKKLAQEIEKQTALKTDYENQLKGIKIQTKLSGMLGAYKTVYDDLPPVAKEAAINALVTQALSESDANFTFDEKGNLVLQKKDGSNLFGDNHTQVTPQAFLDKTVSKILKVSTPANPGNTTPSGPVLNSSGQQQQGNPVLSQKLKESLESYEASTKNGVAV